MKRKKYFEVRRHYPIVLYLLDFVSEENKATIMDDPFIRFYIGDLLRTLRTQYLIDLIKPYTRLELEFLARVCDTCTILCPNHYP